MWRDNTPERGDIFYTRSMDGGATFGGIINLSNTTGSSGSPAIAISANNVYVVWSDNTGTGEDAQWLFIWFSSVTPCKVSIGAFGLPVVFYCLLYTQNLYLDNCRHSSVS